jgi:hypothetical protein
MINAAVFPIDCGAGRNTLADYTGPIRQCRARCLVWHIHRSFAATRHNARQGAGMGDKGGKKDKEKSKQQQVKKQKQEAQRKQDKARPRNP